MPVLLRIAVYLSVVLLLGATLACAMPDPISQALARIGVHAGPTTAGAIAAMPFLQTPTVGSDLSAITSLAELASRDPNALSDLLRHPALADNGITDALTWRIAPYADLHATTLLDPQQWHLSQYTATPPDHSYQATIGILAPADLHNPPAVDVIREAIRISWQLAGQPPSSIGARRHLAITVVLGLDLGPDVQARATDAHIAVSRRHSRDNPAHRWILAHETAHLWWRNNAAWIDEGMAEFTASAVTAAPQPPQVRAPCAVSDISTWLKTRSAPHTCDMNLGHRLFADLHAAAPEHFVDHIQTLYRLSHIRSLTETDILRIFEHPRYQSVTDRWLPQATLPRE